MGKSYRDYSDEIRKNQSPEAAAAAEVFDNAYTIAVAIHSARDRSGMTQDEVSALTGVDQADISRIERGQMIPTVPTLQKLAGALGGALVLSFDSGEQTILSRAATVEPAAPRRADIAASSRPRVAPMPGTIAAFHR